MTINRETILRVIICIDFVMVSMVLMSEWLPSSYLLNQAVLLALGFAAIIHRGSALQVELLMLMKFISIIIDSVTIGLYFHIGRRNSTYFVFSAFCAIFLLVLKPVMLLLLTKVRQDRLNDAAYDAWTPTSGYMAVDSQG